MGAMSTWFRVWTSYLWSKKFIYLLGILSLALTDSMQVLMMELLGIIIDFFNGNQIPEIIQLESQHSTFLLIVILFILNRVLMTAGRVGWRLTMARQSHIARGYLRTEVWNNAVYFPKKSFNLKFSKGALMNLSTSDNGSAMHIFGFTLVGAFDCLILGLFVISSMWMISPKMTIFILLAVSPLPFMIKKTADKEGELHEVAQNGLTELNDYASQSVSTIRLQRITQTGEFWKKILVDFADRYRIKRLTAMRYSLLFGPLFMMGNTAASIALFAYGIRLVIDGEISVGEFVTFQGLIATLQGPLMEAGYVVTEWKEGSISLKRIVETFTHKKEEFLFAKGDNVTPSNCAFEIKGLNFGFKDADDLLISDFNLKIKAGERIGITGPIGTGKTTLIEIMAGINRDYKGDVYFMGKDIRELDHDSLRQNLFVVAQRPFLFADTVRNNLTMNMRASDEEIWNALEVAGLAEDVKAFKHGLETELGEWGINLSGGQKQRMTLARVLIRRPKVLIIDDALSAVDTVTEQKILSSLDDELKGATIVWVAHRKSTLKYCDRIIELE